MTDISGLIRAAYGVETPEEPRAYIGASGVGHACDANVAFSFRGYPNTPPSEQLKRIFRDGHRIEYDVVKDMRLAGIHVMEKDPLTGKQWRFTSYGGFAMGNADGIIEIDGETIGLEIKTMNDAKFKEFSTQGVKISHPMYFDQMQFMMGLSGITKFVLVSYNKNNSAYHHQYLDFDFFRFSYLEAKVERVLANNTKRVSKDESDWRCRGCFKFDACWNGALPEARTVRTCGNSTGNNDGSFSCSICDGVTCSSWKPYKPKEKA